MINETILIFEIDIFHFLMEISYSVYISQLIRFAGVCYNGVDFNNRNIFFVNQLIKVWPCCYKVCLFQFM